MAFGGILVVEGVCLRRSWVGGMQIETVGSVGPQFEQFQVAGESEQDIGGGGREGGGLPSVDEALARVGSFAVVGEGM